MMNKITLAVALLICSITDTIAQKSERDSTGLPGDHFSLEGALQLFSTSASLEEYEKALNVEGSDVNNLDLNQDGETDYIRLEDKMNGSVHAIVLQVPVNETESQDVAVIEIEKSGESTATLQMVGDPELYGEEIIIEPQDEKPAGNSKGPAAAIETVGVIVNVWFWPSVVYVYTPQYRPWNSPYRWAVYPVWWKPYRVHPWSTHYNNCRKFRGHYVYVTDHRLASTHAFYQKSRVTSGHVHSHYAPAHSNRKQQNIEKQKVGEQKSGKERTLDTPVRQNAGKTKPATKNVGKEKSPQKAKPAQKPQQPGKVGRKK